MEQIWNYIINLFMGNGIIIAVGAFVLGSLIKGSLDVVPNKYIPLICGVLGAVVGACVPGIFGEADWFTALVQGMALAWAATGGYETIRNLINKKDGNINA